MSITGTTPIRFAGGYQTGDPSAIARRYQTKGTWRDDPSGYGWQGEKTYPGRGPGYWPAPSEGAPPRLPQSGAAGPAGSPAPESSAVDTAPRAVMPSGGGVTPPEGNAAQRWQAGGSDTQDISPQRRFFWATGLVDARATPAPQNAPTDFDSTFGPNRTHMGSAGTTWQDRQASNDAGVANAVKQRGLPSDWAPY